MMRSSPRFFAAEINYESSLLRAYWPALTGRRLFSSAPNRWLQGCTSQALAGSIRTCSDGGVKPLGEPENSCHSESEHLTQQWSPCEGT